MTKEIRIARIEAVCDSIRAENEDVLRRAYLKAVEDRNEEEAAFLARKIRNRLLSESDKEYAIDRLFPEAPTGTSFTDWLSWLGSLGKAVSGEWGKYRQALRDIPEQEGFPFDIVFPKSPCETEKEEADKEAHQYA
ncbi:MAG: phage tail assembly chaperone [Clostridia bacterium]|nr:phage tail assembly chaperone [Clostridia bacterium]